MHFVDGGNGSWRRRCRIIRRKRGARQRTGRGQRRGTGTCGMFSSSSSRPQPRHPALRYGVSRGSPSSPSKWTGLEIGGSEGGTEARTKARGGRECSGSIRTYSSAMIAAVEDITDFAFGVDENEISGWLMVDLIERRVQSLSGGPPLTFAQPNPGQTRAKPFLAASPQSRVTCTPDFNVSLHSELTSLST